MGWGMNGLFWSAWSLVQARCDFNGRFRGYQPGCKKTPEVQTVTYLINWATRKAVDGQIIWGLRKGYKVDNNWAVKRYQLFHLTVLAIGYIEIWKLRVQMVSRNFCHKDFPLRFFWFLQFQIGRLLIASIWHSQDLRLRISGSSSLTELPCLWIVGTPSGWKA